MQSKDTELKPLSIKHGTLAEWEDSDKNPNDIVFLTDVEEIRAHGKSYGGDKIWKLNKETGGIHTQYSVEDYAELLWYINNSEIFWWCNDRNGNPIKFQKDQIIQLKDSDSNVLDVTIIDVVKFSWSTGTYYKISPQLDLNKTYTYGPFQSEVVNQANGYASVAEGFNTKAEGDYSHAEGGYTNASGDYSHAEGSGAVGIGFVSHAEGGYTNASGDYSHAEGSSTEAKGQASHSEGFKSEASGSCAHAEGSDTEAIGTASHAEGSNTTASGGRAHSEGYYTVASGNNSHAEGFNTKAIGDAAHVEGSGTTGCGPCSHAEGRETTSSGFYSHTEGEQTKAYNTASHAEGCRTIALGYCTHAEGQGSVSSLTGYSWESNSKSISFASNPYLNIGSVLKIENNDQNILRKVTAVSEDGLTVTVDNQISLESNNSNLSVVKGIAYSDCSHSEGQNTIASGSNSHAEGGFTTASGEHSHAEGEGSVSYGRYSHAEGRTSQAYGNASHTEGYWTVAKNLGEHAEGSWNKSNEGTAEDQKTLSSIGIGTSEETRKNAQEVMQNGDYYVIGIGNYDGANATNSEVKTLQEVLEDISDSAKYTAGDNISIEDNEISAVGYKYDKEKESFSVGSNTTASGKGSHAEGLWTEASGPYSHAEGSRTIASSHSSHAEGSNTEAKNLGEHAQGRFNVSNKNSDDFGDELNTIHSIGVGTNDKDKKNAQEVMQNGDFYVIGVGNYNGANIKEEGVKTLQEVLEDISSTASEKVTYTAGENISIEENVISALGYKYNKEKDSFSIGSGSATGEKSYAEGYNTEATEYVSHAEGEDTEASGIVSHAEGSGTTGTGSISHAEGHNTTASSWASHAEGYHTEASGDCSHAEGYDTTASGYYSHAEGSSTNASGYASHAEGYETEAKNDSEHAQGHYNISHTSEESFGSELNTIHSIGIGNSEKRKNAQEVMQNGDYYVIGIGGYDGTNPKEATRLQDVVAEHPKVQNKLTYSDDGQTLTSHPLLYNDMLVVDTEEDYNKCTEVINQSSSEILKSWTVFGSGSADKNAWGYCSSNSNSSTMSVNTVGGYSESVPVFRINEQPQDYIFNVNNTGSLTGYYSPEKFANYDYVITTGIIPSLQDGGLQDYQAIILALSCDNQSKNAYGISLYAENQSAYASGRTGDDTDGNKTIRIIAWKQDDLNVANYQQKTILKYAEGLQIIPYNSDLDNSSGVKNTKSSCIQLRTIRQGNILKVYSSKPYRVQEENGEWADDSKYSVEEDLPITIDLLNYKLSYKYYDNDNNIVTVNKDFSNEQIIKDVFDKLRGAAYFGYEAQSNPGTFFRYVSGFNNNKIINVVGNNYQIESFNPQTSKFEPTSEAVINQLKNGSRLAYNRITKKLFYFDGYNFIHVATVKDDTMNAIESKIAELDSKVDSINTQVSNSGVPKGTVIDWYGDASFDNIPYGWVPCGGFFDKAASSGGSIPADVETESKKWQVKYGSNLKLGHSWYTTEGNARCYIRITKVNDISIPNLSGRFIVGAGISVNTNIGSYELGDTGGEERHKLTAKESGLPSHNHSKASLNVTTAGSDRRSLSAGNNVGSLEDIIDDFVTGGAIAQDAESSHENRPPYYALWKLIKVI